MSTAATTEGAFWKSIERAQAAVQALSLILGPLPEPLAFSDDPAASLLRDDPTAAEIRRRLRRPTSGAGGDDLCRWLYDTFQSTDPSLQLAVVQFVPAFAAAYLPRAAQRAPLAGFEAVLLALYAHETAARAGDPLTVSIPNLSTPSVYHDDGKPASVGPTPPTAILSPALEPHGTVRSTRRARIVGVALELYYSKISQMPLSSKLEFCEICADWAGKVGVLEKGEDASGRIPLPWELLQPMLRIVGHCLMGGGGEELRAVALEAARRLHARAVGEVSPQAVLATRSLVRLGSVEPVSLWEEQTWSVVTVESPGSDSSSTFI